MSSAAREGVVPGATTPRAGDHAYTPLTARNLRLHPIRPLIVEDDRIRQLVRSVENANLAVAVRSPSLCVVDCLAPAFGLGEVGR